MRLDKYLCDLGLGSRSRVKELIKAGRVTVDGVAVTRPEFSVMEGSSQVLLGDKPLVYEKYRYYLLNKPAGCVCAVSDRDHDTVIKYLEGENLKGLSPVGRLDLDTEGVLLITNDGNLSHKIISPQSKIPKTYFAKLDRECPKSAKSQMEEGLDIGDDKPTMPARLEVLDGGLSARLTIYEGRYHQVKRMFSALGCNVIYLRRERIGSLTAEGLAPGEFRRVTREEILNKIGI